MKNFKKVLDELKLEGFDFYVGGSLSLWVFHYITRTPKDLDIQSTDPNFLQFAKEMQAEYPLPSDARGQRELFFPESYDEIWERQREELDEKNKAAAEVRHPFKSYAAFMLHGVKIEVYKNEVKEWHIVHDCKFVDPNEVLYYKHIYQGRRKDWKDIVEALKAIYPERDNSYILEIGYPKECILGVEYSCGFQYNQGYVGNTISKKLVEEVCSGHIKPRPLTSYSKSAKVVREKIRMIFKLPEKPLPRDDSRLGDPNRYLSDEPQKRNENIFKLHGVSRDRPSVTIHKTYVIIQDEYVGKVSLSRKAFTRFADDDIVNWKKLQTFRLSDVHSNAPLLKICPRSMYIIDKQKRRIRLSRKAFGMLKTVIQMI